MLATLSTKSAGAAPALAALINAAAGAQGGLYRLTAYHRVRDVHGWAEEA